MIIHKISHNYPINYNNDPITIPIIGDAELWHLISVQKHLCHSIVLVGQQ